MLAELKSSGNGITSVAVDLQGAKMRIGKITPVSTLPESVEITCTDTSATPQTIPVPHKRVFQWAEPGEELWLNDGKIIIRIEETFPDTLKGRVIKNGELSSFKGINKKGQPLPFEDLSSKDKEIVQLCNEFEFTEIALSFVNDGTELKLLKGHTSRKIIAKIERPESFAHLDQILSFSDEMWLCRGDLGSQTELKHMAELQNQFERFIQRSSQNRNIAKQKQFFLAGQVFEHLTHFPSATRSEVVHYVNSMRKGYDGIVLSDETAIGKNPENALSYIRSLD